MNCVNCEAPIEVDRCWACLPLGSLPDEAEITEVSDCCGRRAKFIDDAICCLACFEPCEVVPLDRSP